MQSHAGFAYPVRMADGAPTHHETDPAEARPDLSVVIPMYNESARILPTLAAVRTGLATVGLRAEVLLIDDGSSDDTTKVVTPELHDGPRGAVVRTALIRHGVNQGKGAAVRTGLIAARAPRRLMMDADGSNTVEDVRTLIDAMDRTGASLAVGSRAMPGVRLKARLSRRLVGYAFRMALRVLGVWGVRDTQCGFKLYTAEAAGLVERYSRERRFAFDIEHILLCRKAGLGVVEVGVPWEHRDGSKVNVVRDGLAMLASTLRIQRRLAKFNAVRTGPSRDEAGEIEPPVVESRPLQPTTAERSN